MATKDRNTDPFGSVNASSASTGYPADFLAPGQDQGRKAARKEFDAAFALRDEDAIRVDMAQASRLFAEEGRDLRGKIGIGIVVFVALFFFSLCIRSTLGNGFISPLDVADGIAMHFQVWLGGFVGQPVTLDYAQMVEQHPGYYQVETRFVTSLVAAGCGVMLALAGSLYQMVFKNPIAAPTMLGVSNGVQIGLLIFVLIYQFTALQVVELRYVFSYAGAAAVLVCVLLLTRAICGKGHGFSIFELLMVGSIFSQLCGGVVQAITDTVMTDDLWEVYQTVSEASNLTLGTAEVVFIIIALAVTVVPVFLMRYAVNTVSYSDLEARLIGLDTSKLKIVCLVFGTIMVTAAQACMGTVSMIALVIPFISRGLFGTEFKHQFWGDLVLGAIVLLLCKDLVLMFPFYGMELTLGSVVTFVTLPFYVWIIASRQRGWK